MSRSGDATTTSPSFLLASSTPLSSAPAAIAQRAAQAANAPRANKSQPFWLGGAASMGAACISHPLDLLKVRLQCSVHAPTQNGVAAAPRDGMLRIVGQIVARDGVLSLYNGLSASLMRQATYSTVRFGCYEALKSHRLQQLRDRHAADPQHPLRTVLSMNESIAFSLVSGSIGGVAGNPADLVNVRMQNDKKLPEGQRRNYRNVFDGLGRIARADGVASLWNGVGPNVVRAALMTTGQLASYDVFKSALVARGLDEKRISTHLTASCLAGVVATCITQPVDVVKTRIMNACHGSSTGGASASLSSVQVVRNMLTIEGPLSFFKGFLPQLARLGPHTVATFLLLEQLKALTA